MARVGKVTQRHIQGDTHAHTSQCLCLLWGALSVRIVGLLSGSPNKSHTVGRQRRKKIKEVWLRERGSELKILLEEQRAVSLLEDCTDQQTLMCTWQVFGYLVLSLFYCIQQCTRTQQGSSTGHHLVKHEQISLLFSSGQRSDTSHDIRTVSVSDC